MEQEPTDNLGIASVVLGVITWMACFGSCIPYVGFLAMVPSMFLSLIGTILGIVGARTCTTNGTSPGLSITGAVLNGIPLLIWVLYWLFVLFSMVALVAMMVLVVVIDAVN